MALIDEFISQIPQRGNGDKQGGSHLCYLMGQYALIKGAFCEADMDFIIETSKKLSAEGVAVVPTLEYSKVKESPLTPKLFLGYVLQRKAQGEELHKASYSKQAPEEYYGRIEELANRPQEFYDKFVSDWLAICKSGLQIDASKSSNFFYTPEKISFIDLNKAVNDNQLDYAFNASAVALFNGGAYYHFSNHGAHKHVLNKLVNAFEKQGENVDRMYDACKKHFPDIADFALKDVNKTPNIIKTTKERE